MHVVRAVLSRQRHDLDHIRDLRSNLAAARREHREYVSGQSQREEKLQRENRALSAELLTVRADLGSAERALAMAGLENGRLRVLVEEEELGHGGSEHEGEGLSGGPEAAVSEFKELIRQVGQENMRQMNLLSSITQVRMPGASRYPRFLLPLHSQQVTPPSDHQWHASRRPGLDADGRHRALRSRPWPCARRGRLMTLARTLGGRGMRAGQARAPCDTNGGYALTRGVSRQQGCLASPSAPSQPRQGRRFSTSGLPPGHVDPPSWWPRHVAPRGKNAGHGSIPR